MHRVALASSLLFVAALACVTGPRIEVPVGATRDFDTRDGFAVAALTVLGMENPDFEDADLVSLQEILGSALGWRGLRTTRDDEADWLLSCAFRKRIIWKGAPSIDPISQPWRPGDPDRRPRVLGGTRTEYRTRGALEANAPQAPEPWVETRVELRLRSRRTGTVGWSAERIWGRDRHELPEDELRETLEQLLAQLRLHGQAQSAPPDSPR